MVKRETRYAKSDGVSIAYQVVGDGPHDLILVPGFVSHVEVAWEQPRLAHFLGRLASFSRLIVFDKRGSGMSDPVDHPPSMEQRMDDIRAVMDAAGSRRATLFEVSEGGTLSLLFAYKHPERTRALVLYGSWARRLAGPDYPCGPSAEQLEDTIVGMDRAWASGTWWDGGRASPADDAQHRVWWARYLRMAASPAMAQNAIRMNMRMDVRDLLPKVEQPTLILHREGDTWIEVGHARYLAEHLPGARYVELPGSTRVLIGPHSSAAVSALTTCVTPALAGFMPRRDGLRIQEVPLAGRGRAIRARSGVVRPGRAEMATVESRINPRLLETRGMAPSQ